MESADDVESLKKYNGLYLEIINRYRDYIEEHENLYIAELPKLVKPDEKSVAAFASALTAKMDGYGYDRDFPKAAMAAFAHVNEAIAPAVTPVQFWLAPEQTLSLRCGDSFDKAVLLCSLIIALGNPSSRIIIATGDNYRVFLVYFEFNGELTVMDIEAKKSSAFKSKEEILRAYDIKDSESTSAYEFNNKMYIDIA